MKMINDSFQHFESATQDRTDKCIEEGTHKLRYTGFMGREFMLCSNCWYTEDVE